MGWEGIVRKPLIRYAVIRIHFFLKVLSRQILGEPDVIECHFGNCERTVVAVP